MKRDRENDDEDDDIERTLLGPNRSFSISPDSNCSNTNATNNHHKDNQNATICTSTTPPLDNENPSNATIGATSNNNNNNSNKEQDRFLPIANVGRIMKKVIPGNAKISKDAKETVQECVSEFISFVTGEASDKCQREKRKTINGDDILWAIMTLGFEDYVNPLKLYLTKYRDIEGEKLNVPKQQQQQHRLHLEQKPDMEYGNVYSSTSLIHPPSFTSPDSPFPLPFSQSSMRRPPQDNLDEHW